MNLQTGQVNPIKIYQIPNALNGICFSENKANLIAAGNGEGYFLMYDYMSNSENPLIKIKVHKDVINTVACNHFLPFLYITNSTDGTTNLIDVNSQKVDKVWMSQPKQYLTDIVWHPKLKSVFASASVDGRVLLFDLSKSKKDSVINIDAQSVLTLDFNKYDHTLVTGSTDSTIKVYDLRNPKMPVCVLSGHRYGITRARFSPFDKFSLLSCSYDMSVKLWSLKDIKNSLIKTHNKHREFVYDIDWNLHRPNLIISASLDKRYCIFNPLLEQPYL